MDEQAPEPLPPDPDDLSSGEPIPDVVPVVVEPDPAHLVFWISLAVVGVFWVVLVAVSEPTRKFAVAGLEVLPFLGLSLLAYLGLRHTWARALTGVYLALFGSAVCLFLFGFTFLAVADVNLFGTPSNGQASGNPPRLLLPGGLLQLALTALGLVSAVILGALCFLPLVRRGAARFLPLDPRSFVHATALATVVGFTTAFTVPLSAVGHPPLLQFFDHFRDQPFVKTMMKDQEVSENLYPLGWLIWVAILAVGYPLTRSLGQALRRVGLVVPRWWHLPFALGAAGILAVGMTGLEHGITWLWEQLGWPTTDSKAFEDLMKSAINPTGALIIGVTAGLGEELAIRGVLQPRLGILLSNLFFTSLHALQYNFDGLLSVFLVGLILGTIRKYTNTTTSAIVHGTYDFTLIMMLYIERQGGWQQWWGGEP